jgi:hypothetical protein
MADGGFLACMDGYGGWDFGKKNIAQRICLEIKASVGYSMVKFVEYWT